MAAVSLFWDTNMAAVTSCENTLNTALINLVVQFTSRKIWLFSYSDFSLQECIIISTLPAVPTLNKLFWITIRKFVDQSCSQWIRIAPRCIMWSAIFTNGRGTIRRETSNASRHHPLETTNSSSDFLFVAEENLEGDYWLHSHWLTLNFVLGNKFLRVLSKRTKR